MGSSKRVRQQDRSDCGPASLASVAAHWGMKIPIPEIRVKSGADSSGCTIKGLSDAAKHFGFISGGYRGDISSLNQIPLPAILHFVKDDGFLHFSVLYEVLKKGYKIMDPADGRFHIVNRESLVKEWSGILVVVTPDKIAKDSGIKLSLIKRLFNIASANFRIYLMIFALSVVHICASLAISLFIKYLLDNIIAGKEIVNLSVYAFTASSIIVIIAITSLIKQRLLIKVTVKTDKRLITDYISQIHLLPLGYFRSMGTGEFISRINDIYRIRNFINETLTGGLTAVLTMLFAIAVLFYIEPGLAFICLCFIPLYISIFLIHDTYSKPVSKKLVESASKFQSSVIESVKSAETIKNMAIESLSVNNILKKLDPLTINISKTGNISAAAFSASELSSGMLTVAVLVVGGVASVSGHITVGELVSFYAVTSLFSTPLLQLASSVSTFREGVIAAERIFDIEDSKKENPDGLSIAELKAGCVKAKLAAENISFSYPGRGIVFDNLSFSLKSGEIVAITGRSGSGKSTVASLLMRHIQPDTGRITYNGTDINHFKLKEWREIISIVPQNPSLYGSTLLNCILCGEDNLKDKNPSLINDIITSLEIDRIAESLPNGLSSWTGEGGVILSRGQQQRIAFARAAIREPQILILDEATSSLDEKSQEFICNYTLKLREKGVAIILITHNNKTLSIADKVISLNS